MISTTCCTVICISVGGWPFTLSDLRFIAAIGDDFQLVDRGLATSNKLLLVNKLLYGVHLVAAAESVALGACAGLNDIWKTVILSHGSLLLEFMPGCASGYGEEICSTLNKYRLKLKVWEKVIDAHSSPSVIVDSSETMEHKMEGLAKTALKVDSASFIGLGAVGFGMASHLVKGGSREDQGRVDAQIDYLVRKGAVTTDARNGTFGEKRCSILSLMIRRC
ncbi:hypothetical protein R1sor_017416 [Riccia sorocarpa]|uniref:Uncharacterized protein n=1 Tax=Riccia sorocarpa TaxID=122646 RepID=A0ABD3ID10_9MARC